MDSRVFLWALVSAGVVAFGLGFWLLVRPPMRSRMGNIFRIVGGVSLILVMVISLARAVTLFVPPNAQVDSGTFYRPAPVDERATVFYLSPAMELGGMLHTTTDSLIAVVARTGAIRWQRTLPRQAFKHLGYVFPSYAVEGNIAYVATSDDGDITIAAYRGADGAKLWQTTVSNSFPNMTIAVNGNALYILSIVERPQMRRFFSIIALRASDGAKLWSIETNVGAIGQTTLIAASDTVYLGTPSDAIYVGDPPGVRAYRASDGKLLWTHVWVVGQEVFRPVASGDVVYLPSGNHSILAVRAHDGSTICETSDNLHVHMIALAGHTLYAAARQPGDLADGQGKINNNETVYTYNATTCAPLWHTAVQANNSADVLIAGDSTIYVSADGRIYALRATDGKLLWHRDQVNSDLPAAGWAFVAQPSTLGATLFVTAAVVQYHIIGGSDGRFHLYAISPDGSYYWDTPVGHVTRFYPHWVL